MKRCATAMTVCKGNINKFSSILHRSLVTYFSMFKNIAKIIICILVSLLPKISHQEYSVYIKKKNRDKGSNN